MNIVSSSDNNNIKYIIHNNGNNNNNNHNYCTVRMKLQTLPRQKINLTLFTMQTGSVMSKACVCHKLLVIMKGVPFDGEYVEVGHFVHCREVVHSSEVDMYQHYRKVQAIFVLQKCHLIIVRGNLFRVFHQECL